MADLIDRQKIKAKFEPWLKVQGYSEGELNMLKAVLYEITIMPSAQPDVPDTNVGDMISRQAAIDAMSCISDSICEQQAVDALCELPSAERHGEWIEENRNPRSWSFYCSVCHRTAYDVQPTRIKGWVKRCRYAFCPNCGARNDGEQHE